MRKLVLSVCLLVTGCNSGHQNMALGTLERERVAHTATVNEVVVALPIPQGSEVTKGTLLVQLDDTFQRTQVSKAAAEVAQAEANLEKLRNGAREEDVAIARARVEGARASLAELQANYERSKELIERKLISKSAFDAALSARDASEANLRSTKEQLRQLTNGTREEDLRVARAHLESAEAVLASENKKLADLAIRATRDGILDNLPWNVGERVTTGSPLAIVLSGKAPFARVYVPEPYRVKLTLGDKLVVHVDGIDEPITGELRWIATEPAFTPYYALNQEERSRLMYLAEVQLPESKSHLPSGIPAQVEMP